MRIFESAVGICVCVPKTAVTQEITANRLVYGNYTQGYDIKRVVGLKQKILSDAVNFPIPEKSIAVPLESPF